MNEVRQLTEKDSFDAIVGSQFNIIHHKTRQSHIHVLSKHGIRALKNLNLKLMIGFQKYKYEFLFGKKNLFIKKFYPSYK